MEAWLAILIFILISLVLSSVIIGMALMVGPRKQNQVKGEAYECGFEALDSRRIKFEIRYYLVAILFIVFDLEIAFLFPWALVFDELGLKAVVAMGVFLLLLVIGFLYEWRKGALKWD